LYVRLLIAAPLLWLTLGVCQEPLAQTPRYETLDSDAAVRPIDMESAKRQSHVRALPKSPLSPRAHAFSIWTGTEMLVVGGTARPCPPMADCLLPPALPDAAAYNPKSNTWRNIPSPFAQPHGQGVLVQGKVIARTAGRELIAYDLATEVWSPLELPAAPGWPLAWNMRAFGDKVAVKLDAPACSDDCIPTIALWDPVAETIKVLPEPPLGPMFSVSLHVAENTLVMLGAAFTPNPGSTGPALTIGATYSEAEGWRKLPDSEIASATEFQPAGRYIVDPSTDTADGGDIKPWDKVYPTGGILNVAERKWEVLPERKGSGPMITPMGAFSPALSLGERVLSRDGFTFDPATRTWQTLPELPTTGRDGAAVTWTGEELLVWGGVTWDQNPIMLHYDGVGLGF
jgi:hypothetical protein